MGRLARLFGRRADDGAPPPLPELHASGEEGWYDCAFAVERAWVTGDGDRALRAAATHGGERVALDVVVGREWTRVDFGPDVPVSGWRGVVRLRSAGPESDRFVAALDRLYGAGRAPGAMAPEVAFTGISLQGDPRALTVAPAKIKLFFEPDGEPDDEEYQARYAEAYLDVDLAARRLELNEKDEDYRGALVRALAGG